MYIFKICNVLQVHIQYNVVHFFFTREETLLWQKQCRVWLAMCCKYVSFQMGTLETSV